MIAQSHRKNNNLKNLLIHFHEQLSSFLVKLQSAVSKAIDKFKPAQKEDVSFLLTSYYDIYLLETAVKTTKNN